RAFASWEASLSAGRPAVGISLGGSSLAELVNRRRIQWRGRGQGSGKPKLLLIGPFGPAFMIDAETVHVVARGDVETAEVTPDGTEISYHPARGTMKDVLRLLPAGWEPDVVLAVNFEMAELPEGIEHVSAPLVGWVGDLINYIDVVADCLPMFDLLIVDQARDVEFARELGLANVDHVLMQALQIPKNCVIDVRPHAVRSVDIAFFGLLDRFPMYGHRRDIVRRALAISDRYNVVALDNIETLDAMSDVLGDAKIGLNVDAEFIGRWAPHPYRYACPRRVYEVMSVGAVCLTPATTAGLAGQFDIGREVVCFTEDDFEAQVERLLSNPGEAASIAAAGRDRTLRDHSTVDRTGEALRLALAANARPNREAKPGAVLRQHYAMHKDGPQRPLPLRDVAVLDPNDRACVDAIEGRPSAAPFARAAADAVGSVVPLLNAFSAHVEAVEWDHARETGDALIAVVDAPVSPASCRGWMRRELYLGVLPGALWWRTDLRIELGNAVYADPSRGEVYTEALRRHLQVAVRDAVGCVAYAQGNPAHARAVWEAAYELDARDEYVSLRLAAYWESEGDDELATLWSRRAAEVRPFNVHNAVRMALIHERRGEMDAASTIFASLGYRRINSREEALAWSAADADEMPVPGPDRSA
ncbi:MAG: glycosyltransferase, partial [Candidatus Poribacteria bacterium]